MIFEVTAIIKGIGQTKAVGQKGFQIREFWLDMTDKPEYPNTPQFQATGDRTALLDNFQSGQQVKVRFALQGRKWEKDGRSGVFTSLNMISIESVGQATVPQAPAQQQQAATTTDELPF